MERLNVLPLAIVCFAMINIIKGLWEAMNHGDPDSAMASVLVGLTYVIIALIVDRIIKRRQK